MKLNTQTSVVDFLKSQGQDSSFGARTTLATQHGIQGYKGTAQQNTQLLGLLQNQQKATTPTATKQATAPKPTTTVAQPKATPQPKPTNQQVSLNLPTRPQTPIPQTSNLTAIEKMLRDNSDAFVRDQTATLEQNRDHFLTELEKAYNDAVMQGEMSVRDAERQFEQHKQQVNENAYRDAQATNLSAEARGIGNSQQMLAMEQGNQRHRNNQMNEVITQRDMRINDIQDRIANITKQRDLDVANANNQFNSSVRQAQAQADMMFNQNMFNVHHEDFVANRNQGFTIDNMNRQQGFTQDNMRLDDTLQQGRMHLGQQFTQDNMRLGQQFTQDNMRLDDNLQQGRMHLNQQFTQANMNLQHTQNKEMASIQQNYTQANMRLGHTLDLQKMSQQLSNDLKKIGVQQANARANMERQHQMNVQAEQQAYEIALKRLEAQHTPGTREFEVAQQQLLQQRNTAINDSYSKIMFDANMQHNLGIVSQGAPQAPKNTLFGGITGSNAKAQQQYQQQLEAYNRAINQLNNPTSMAQNQFQPIGLHGATQFNALR